MFCTLDSCILYFFILFGFFSLKEPENCITKILFSCGSVLQAIDKKWTEARILTFVVFAYFSKETPTWSQEMSTSSFFAQFSLPRSDLDQVYSKRAMVGCIYLYLASSSYQNVISLLFNFIPLVAIVVSFDTKDADIPFVVFALSGVCCCFPLTFCDCVRCSGGEARMGQSESSCPPGHLTQAPTLRWIREYRYCVKANTNQF